jgi:hypothetical protein
MHRTAYLHCFQRTRHRTRLVCGTNPLNRPQLCTLCRPLPDQTPSPSTLALHRSMAGPWKHTPRSSLHGSTQRSCCGCGARGPARYAPRRRRPDAGEGGRGGLPQEILAFSCFHGGVYGFALNHKQLTRLYGHVFSPRLDVAAQSAERAAAGSIPC